MTQALYFRDFIVVCDREHVLSPIVAFRNIHGCKEENIIPICLHKGVDGALCLITNDNVFFVNDLRLETIILNVFIGREDAPNSFLYICVKCIIVIQIIEQGTDF